jgi:hypothetical protein
MVVVIMILTNYTSYAARVAGKRIIKVFLVMLFIKTIHLRHVTISLP